MSISYLTDFGIYDLATLTIYYKIGNESGSYDFPPPHASLKSYPQLEAYKKTDRITKLFYSMTDNGRSAFKNQRRKWYKGN